MNEVNCSESDAAKRSVFDHVVICFRWAWCWKGFWNGWYKEVKGVPLLAWMGLIGVIAAIMQIVITLVYPLWRLLIEPIKVSINIDSKTAENIEKIIEGR